MIKSKRQDELYEIISATGYASVGYLSQRTFQSQSTIRRDLDELELPYIARDRRLSDLKAALAKAVDKLRLRIHFISRNYLGKCFLSFIFHSNSPKILRTPSSF